MAPNDHFFKEEFHETNVQLSSKIHFFKDPMNFHEDHNDSHMATNRGNIVDRLSSSKFHHKLEIMSTNLNKIHQTIDKDTFYNLYYQNFVTRDLGLFHNKSYYGKSEIIKIVINNLKTKFKNKNNVEKFLKKIKNKKLRLEIMKIKEFLINFNI